MDERIDAVAERLRTAETAAALTGAGVSAASGVPTFRGESGVWNERFDPSDFRLGRFETDPGGFWADRIELHAAMFPDDVAPNPAHEALARLEDGGALDAVITQNTDGLHVAAGTDRPIELHGSAERVVCRDCGRRTDAGPVRERVRDGERPPRCEECGGVYKPDVVLFGERLPEESLAEARRLAAASDVFLAVGSSLTVEPAASLPVRAARDGTLAIVNLDPTERDDRANYLFREDATELLPRLADAALD